MRANVNHAREIVTTSYLNAYGISSFSAEYQRFFDYGKVNQRYGPRAYVAYSQTTWQSDSIQPFVAGDLGIVSGGVRAFLIVINKPATELDANSFSFSFELGATFRSLLNDGTDNSILRQRTLGTTETFFWGPELLATIQVRALSGFFGLSVLRKPNGVSINGLTGPQPVFGFKLDAPIFSFKT